jgi:hypothetical protein
MASEPYEPPESIMLGQFLGLDTVTAEERLAIGDLSIARNIYLDDVGKMRARQGFARDNVSSHHSARRVGGRAFVVRDGVLGVLDLITGFAPLATVGTDPLSYVEIDGTVYVSSVSFSAKVSPLNAITPWGVTGDPGQWISPVMTPTDTLGAVAGRQFVKPPLAAIIEHYKGRMYLAVGKVLWATELYLYDHVDRMRNFVQFESTITMVRAVENGFYVGTETGLYFLSGTLAEGLRRVSVVDAGVVPGSDTVIPARKTNPGERQAPMPEGTLPIFLTTDGVCIGRDNGDVLNLTEGRVRLPKMTSAAAFHRDEPGASIYVVTDIGGTAWAVNTRTGAVTEYENYTFNSFTRLGNSYLGAASDGLYVLAGPDDAGTEIAVRVRTGLMRFGGNRLSRLKAIYVTARSIVPMRLTVETATGTTYVYAITPVAMRTTKLHVGKGMRATQFLLDWTCSALDLDIVELVPLIVRRRV